MYPYALHSGVTEVSHLRSMPLRYLYHQEPQPRAVTSAIDRSLLSRNFDSTVQNLRLVSLVYTYDAHGGRRVLNNDPASCRRDEADTHSTMGLFQSKATPAAPCGTTEQRERLQKKQDTFKEEVGQRDKTRAVDVESERKTWKAQEEKLRREIKEAKEARKQAEERADALQHDLTSYRDEARSLREEVRQTLRDLKEVIERDLAVALEAKLQAERRLWEGRRSILFPSQAQYAETRHKLQYEPGIFHFAVSGISGSGKSSLINAFRGLRNASRQAAPVGVVETTSKVVRYPDSTGKPYAWYDVPGAGTLSIPDWQYFTDQGLYIFDCIIVVLDARFTATDIAILRNCVSFQIPTFIVRSKSRQHIANVTNDIPADGDQDGEDDLGDDHGSGGNMRDRTARARESYIQDTRRCVKRELEKAGLDSQRVYIIDKDDLVKTVKGKPCDSIDEDDLLNDMFALAAQYGPAEPAEITGPDGTK